MEHPATLRAESEIGAFLPHSATEKPPVVIDESSSGGSFAARISTTSVARAEFARTGWAGPIAVFTPVECRQILGRLRQSPAPLAADWMKGFAATHRAFYDVATYQPLLEAVIERLGPDVMLWGAHLVKRIPGQKHHWHTDIESSNPEGRTLSVWLGLEGTTLGSSLRLIAGSHRLGVTIQQVALESGHKRDDRGAENAMAWARQRDARCELIKPDMSDGQALLFDGRLWHGSHNDNQMTARTALVLQYAAPDTPIFIPDLTQVEWPFRNRHTPRPACIMVSGTDHGGSNRLVPPPARLEPGDLPRLSTWAEPLGMPLSGDPARGYRAHKQFRGSTTNLSDLSCHASVLYPGKTPHPPHEHIEEEVLIMLDGEADLTIVDPAPGGARKHRLRVGSFVYYPAGQLHTLTAAGEKPATYLMFKWHSRFGRHDGDLKTSILSYLDADTADSGAGGYRAKHILDGPTQLLRKFHCHLTTLAPGGGYAAHVDAHDVAILTLRGTVETLGRRVGPHSIIFYSGGESHGMRNPGPEPAAYLVFEFHGSNDRLDDPGAPKKSKGSLARRGARFLKRNAKKLIARVTGK